MLYKMPEIGQQHIGAGNTANPFEECKPHISVYTAHEIATLSRRLKKQLGPEYISSRPGAAGQRVHYLAADKCINLANEVLGFNGWSSAIKQIQIDYVGYTESDSMTCSTDILRLTKASQPEKSAWACRSSSV